MLRLHKVLLWGLVGIFLLNLFPGHSFAHAYIVRSTPSENETLARAPSMIRIEFNEEIQDHFYSLKLINEAGQSITLNQVRIDKNHPKILEANLPNALSQGTYMIQWRVVSSDGHPVKGTIPFQIGQGGKTETSILPKTKNYLPQLDMVWIRWLFYVSSSLFVGMLFFKQIVEPKQETFSFSFRYNALYWLAYIGMSLSILLSLPLQITVEADVPWSKAWSVSFIKKMITDSSFGSVWLIQIACLGLLLITGSAITYFHQRQEKRLKRWVSLSFIIGMGLLFTKSLLGHTAASPHRMISVLIDFLHLLAASLWLGSLCMIAIILPLELLAKKEKDWHRYWAAIKRFSYWGAIFACGVMMTGAYMSLQQVPTFSALLSTMYGKFLMGKVMLLMMMLLLASIHIWARKKGRKLGLSIWGEWGIGIIVLLLAAVLTNLPPATAAPGPFQQTKEVHGYTIVLKVTPNILGTNHFTIHIKNQKGQPVQDIEQVTVTLASKEMDMGENVLQVRGNQSGTYQIQGMISMAGRWNIHIHALTTSLQSIDADFECFVGSQ
ncbi:Copper transport protein YcnJ [Anoxybacillus sp. P3H1B]|uniref:copper resistance protein CopC n=1 Tax=Anoxybacillus sp. P3H1B TaxID=1769293 RepID=UPI0007941258|nr:copper resistance protein CopC [Anoxybacillus sp. P3H1B]KXG10650.1 Copper transport protein YcnJ [Anoxybacillus sp. P3H1B]